ncbi:hypothetical protein [Gracilibacillus kekensis]|uniref:Uncharacterized protein n=1 Tax=Gracilibacillus kekensis TaxID=1027249 RepID=A0A1M7QQD1_9BACI|nr:hypothetical protein [Gracilibacillus kekensis]SHN33714.1 hypothetical protein SAMN05216179_3459 [Gracilibacillus kekensis]
MKRSITSYTKADLLKMAKIKHNTVFNRRLDKINEHYDLALKSINPFKVEVDNEKSPYEIPFEVAELLSTLLYSIEFNPYFRTNADDRKIEAYSIIDFYKTLIEEIENFPLFEQYKIKEHPAYLNTLKEVDILPKLIEKISETIVVLEQITQQERGDIMIHIYKRLDEWIFNAYSNNSYLKMARLSNLEYMKEKIDEEVMDDPTVVQESINTLDTLIVERIKMWTGLTGEEIVDIKKNVLDKKKGKKEFESYIQKFLNMEGNNGEELRGFIEMELLESLYDGRFEDHRIETDDLIKNIKESKYEEKLVSYKAEKQYEKWKNADQVEQQEYIKQWKESRISKVKQQISAYEEVLHSLECDDDYSFQKVTEEMDQLERFLEFKKNIKNSKLYEEASNLFLGQLMLQNLKK